MPAVTSPAGAPPAASRRDRMSRHAWVDQHTAMTIRPATGPAGPRPLDTPVRQSSFAWVAAMTVFPPPAPAPSVYGHYTGRPEGRRSLAVLFAWEKRFCSLYESCYPGTLTNSQAMS